MSTMLRVSEKTKALLDDFEPENELDFSYDQKVRLALSRIIAQDLVIKGLEERLEEQKETIKALNRLIDDIQQPF